MKPVYVTCLGTLLTVLLPLIGCNDSDKTDSGKTDNSANVDGDSKTSDAVHPKDLVIGKWTVDQELTKQGWGDRLAEMEKKLSDQLGMTIEFKDENQFLITNNDGNGETYDVYWEITDSSDTTLQIVIAESKDAKKKIQVNISFINSDQLKYQSSEGEFEDDLIFNRATN